MKRRIHVPNLYAFGPPLTGPAAAICWQEGHPVVAGLLAVAFVALFVGGLRRVRVYWR